MSTDKHNLLKKIIAEHLAQDLEKVTPNARLTEDLGADSLDTADLLNAINEQLHSDIRIEEAGSLLTVQDFINRI